MYDIRRKIFIVLTKVPGLLSSRNLDLKTISWTIGQKYDSKDKSVRFFLKRIYHIGGPKQSSVSVFPGLDRSSSTFCLRAVLLNLKFQLDKLKNNKEKTIIVFFANF
jgi:hypothetical protein